MEAYQLRSIAGNVLLETTVISSTFISWLISFLFIYLPTSGFIKQNLFLNVNFQQKLIFFMVTTALASSALLIKGIQLIRKPNSKSAIPKQNKSIYDLNKNS